jgi:hypothetical protein
MPQLAKAYSSIIEARLTRKAEEEGWRAHSQGGFRRKHPTDDNAVMLKLAAERSAAVNKPLYVCLVDLEKAFDKVNRAVLWRTLREDLGLDCGAIAHL